MTIMHMQFYCCERLSCRVTSDTVVLSRDISVAVAAGAVDLWANWASYLLYKLFTNYVSLQAVRRWQLMPRQNQSTLTDLTDRQVQNVQRLSAGYIAMH